MADAAAEQERKTATEPVIVGRWKRWQWPLAAVYFLGGLLLVWTLQSPALLPWAGFGLLGYGILCLLTTKESGMRETYWIAYGIISLFGWVVCADNLRNFGVAFGCFNDDSEYYYNMTQILAAGKFKSSGVYEMLLAGIGWCYHLVGVKEIPLTSLLPFNFMLAGWCVVLTGLLAKLVAGRAIPAFLLLLCTAGNYYFIEAMSRLYRDGVVMVLMVGALCLFAAQRPVSGFLSSVAAGVFRGANGMVALLFGAVYWFKRWIHYTAHFWMLAIALLVVGIVAVRLVPFCFFSVVGDQTKTGRYITKMERQNTFLQLLNRRKALARYFPPGSMARKLYKLGGVSGNAGLAASMVFFPLTVRGTAETVPVASRYILDTTVSGQFYYNLLKWLFVLAWLPVIPLLCCGILAAMRGSHLGVTTAFVYLLLVAGVTLISMQQRHCCAFVILHPALATLGYYLAADHRFLLKLRKGLFIIVPLGIILWNILRYGLLA